MKIQKVSPCFKQRILWSKWCRHVFFILHEEWLKWLHLRLRRRERVHVWIDQISPGLDFSLLLFHFLLKNNLRRISCTVTEVKYICRSCLSSCRLHLKLIHWLPASWAPARSHAQHVRLRLWNPTQRAWNPPLPLQKKKKNGDTHISFKSAFDCHAPVERFPAFCCLISITWLAEPIFTSVQKWTLIRYLCTIWLISIQHLTALHRFIPFSAMCFTSMRRFTADLFDLWTSCDEYTQFYYRVPFGLGPWHPDEVFVSY